MIVLSPSKILYNNDNIDCLLRLIAAIYRMAELQSYLQNI